MDRKIPPKPWVEGDNIPWNDPAFSERMLAEHLSQQHDRASRRGCLIDAHVRFLAGQLPGLDGARILDLGCGPGLYLHRLARLGHGGHGIDFSPAAIDHARSVASREKLDCRFELGDLRRADFGTGFDLVLLIFGQFNVFERQEAREILRRAHSALVPGGVLVLEPQTPEGVRGPVDHETHWTAEKEGLFASEPHLLLQERFWDEASRTATERWYVVHADPVAVDCHSLSVCSWEREELVGLLGEEGYDLIEIYPSLSGDETAATPDLFALTAVRPVESR